jgi:hypothetical protein
MKYRDPNPSQRKMMKKTCILLLPLPQQASCVPVSSVQSPTSGVARCHDHLESSSPVQPARGGGGGCPGDASCIGSSMDAVENGCCLVCSY